MATHEYLRNGKQRLTGILVEIADADLSFSNPVRVRKGIDPKPIGEATLTRSNAGLIADITINGKEEIAGLSPAIGFRIQKQVHDSKTGARLYREGTIYELQLSAGPNMDLKVKPIGRQVTIKKQR